MKKSAGVSGMLFAVLAIIILCPATAQAEMSVQIKTAPDQDILPLEVEFEAVVSGGTAPYDYMWSFGDGGSSTLMKDSHYYRESGQYTVRLTVFDSLDDFAVVSKKISVSSTVFDPKNAFFTIYSDTVMISSIVQDIHENNILWLGTPGGLVRLDTVTGLKKIYQNEFPGISAEKIIQSSDGAIWIGEENGLIRFDYNKNKWTVFNSENSGLPSNWIGAILQASDGAIWVGCGKWDGGLARFDYEKDQWTVFNTENSELPSNEIESLYQTSDQAVWAGTTYGLSRFDYAANQWTIYNTENSGLPGNWICCLLQTTDGAVWVGEGRSVARFDYIKNQWTVYDYTNSSLPYEEIRSLLQTPDGFVWIGTGGDGGLARFDYEENQWTLFNLPSFPFYRMQSSLLGADEIIWVGGWNGLFRFDYKNNQCLRLDTGNSGLPSNEIGSLYKTNDNAVWIGTVYDGLVRFDYTANEWKGFYQHFSGLSSNKVGSILQLSDGNMWIGSGDPNFGGLNQFDYEQNKWTNINISSLPYKNFDCLLQTTDGAIWTGGGGRAVQFYNKADYGLARYNHETSQWTMFDVNNSSLPSNYITSLYQTNDKALWVGTWDGLARFDYVNNEWKIFNAGNSQLLSNIIHAVIQASDGALWVGTYGLARFDYEQNEWTIYNTDNSKLPSNYISTLFQSSDGVIWIGTGDGGLTRFDYAINYWHTYNIENSPLPHNFVLSILQSDDGSIWAGTWNGLARISFQNSSKSPGHLILLAGGGAAQTNPLWKTTKELATTVYRIFNSRGFKNTDIFFMCPEKWTDFNGDGYDDHIVDRPMPDEDRNLTVADLEYAVTQRAVNAHTPGTPLYLCIIDHGYADDGIKGPSFMISPGEILWADDLNAMLNTYETATGGQVIVINESCYSGAFMSRLKKPGRIVITSASDHIVNYDNYGSDSFTHHFLRYLFENNTLHQAFSKSVRRLQESNLTFYQTPQLDDNGDGKYDDSDGLLTASLRLGGDFALGAPWPEILSLEKGELSGTSVSFTLSTNARMKRVWATIQPPGYIPEINGNYQNIELEFFNLSDNDEDLTYTGTYEKFTEKGQYILTFYAKDQFGNIAQSAPVRIDVNVSPGDVNGDGDVTLADAVLSLKICAGEDMTGQNISRAADMNQDNRIGTEEAVSVLRKTAGL